VISLSGTDKYIFSVPMLKELDNDSFSRMLEELIAVLADKTDKNIEISKFIYSHDDNKMKLVTNRLESKQADISYLTGLEYSEYLISGGDELIPLFSLGIARTSVVPLCFVTRKGELKSVDELAGKRWQGSGIIPTRYLLYEKGIYKRPEEFFSSIGFTNDSPVSIMINKLINNEIDVFTTYKTALSIGGYLTKKDSGFELLECKDYDHNWIFLARKDVDKSFLKRMTEIMLKAHKDPDFAKFQFAFKMIDGNFINIKKEELDSVYKRAELIVEKEWRKEQTEFHEKYMK